MTTTFGYNSASQITTRSRDNDAYAFTGYVNVSRSYAKNGLNQYTSAGPATFTYDANGNLTSDGTTSYAYDIENRLVSSSNGAALTYDPIGRLWQTTGTASGTTQFLYGGDALVAEYDGAGTMLKRYVHGDGDDDPQVQYTGSSIASPNYLFADHQGSIAALTDANGNVASVNRYDEYGIPGPGNTGRFQYTGQAWLPELGMYYYKARIYSPTLGRFMQTDPIGYDDQVNLYAYVGNDPINGRDPSGMIPCGAHGPPPAGEPGDVVAIAVCDPPRPPVSAASPHSPRPRLRLPQMITCRIGKGVKIAGDIAGQTAAGASILLGAPAGAIAGSELGPPGSAAGALGGAAAFAPLVVGAGIVSSTGQLLMDLSSGRVRGGIARFAIGVGGGRAIGYYVSDVLKVGSLLSGSEREAASFLPSIITDRIKELKPVEQMLAPEPPC